MAASFLFFFLAVVAVGAALGMLLARSPVSSALWLILNLFCVAGLYITLNAQFIGVVQVLVYAGAIMVLFLFVIMLLNLGALPEVRAVDAGKVVAFIAGAAVLALLVYVLADGLDALPQPLTYAEAAFTGSAEVLAVQLFTRYAIAVQVIGILLLAATIGAVLLAQRRYS